MRNDRGCRRKADSALLRSVAEDCRAKYGARTDANALEVAHSRDIPGIGSPGMRLRPQRPFAAQYSKFSYKPSPRITRIHSIAGASWFHNRLIEVEVTSSRTSASSNPYFKYEPICSSQSQA